MTKSTRIFSAILVAFNLALFAGLYFATVAWRSTEMHAKHSRWIGNAYRADSRFGYVPAPNALAFHALQDGPRVPVIFDDDGLRIPYNRDVTPRSSGKRLLFLGDSFTHGYGVAAEKTFSFLTAEKLAGVALNAGVSGWSLTQMLLRAHELVPRLKPDVVVVQYSSWLPERSRQLFGPSGISPVPYFFESRSGLAIQPPVFQTIKHRLPVSDFAGKGLLSFSLHVGMPLFVHDDFLMAHTWIRKRLGLLPQPTTSSQRIVDHVYSEISRLCNSIGARMVVLVLPGTISDHEVYRLDAIPAFVVRTLPTMIKKLPLPTQGAWERLYYIRYGDPPRVVDKHPSAVMHVVIAEILADAIR